MIAVLVALLNGLPRFGQRKEHMLVEALVTRLLNDSTVFEVA
jgi:hypothetical protein